MERVSVVVREFLLLFRAFVCSLPRARGTRQIFLLFVLLFLFGRLPFFIRSLCVCALVEYVRGETKKIVRSSRQCVFWR